MPVLPTQVVAGASYRADDGEHRLVWIVRDGRVFYFSRDDPREPWMCNLPPDQAPPVEEFAAEVVLLDAGGTEAAARAAEDTYGSGDW